LALRCLRFLKGKAYAERDWHIRLMAEDAILRLSAAGGGGRLIAAIAEDLNGSPHGKAAVRLLARLASELSLAPFVVALLGKALRAGDLRDHAARHIGDVVVGLASTDVELASRCVTALRDAAVQDEDKAVRFQAALSLTRLACAPAVMATVCATQSISALRDMSSQGVRAAAATILLELALSLRDAPGGWSERSLTTLMFMAENAAAASDRRTAALQLYAHGIGERHGDLARDCAASLLRQSRSDPDPDVRSQASGLLIDLWYEEASSVRWT